MNVLLIKLGALGDVLRTTPLVPALKEKWPGARVTWMLAEAALPLVARHPDVDEIVTVEAYEAGESKLAGRSWDVIVNLDEDPAATRLATETNAREKYGIGRDGRGRLMPLSPLAEELIRLASDDRFKFRENQLPYQARIFQAVGLTWMAPPYIYTPPPDIASRQARLFPPIHNLTGLFVGASTRYANKFWNEDEIAAFCEARPDKAGLLLFGGPGEQERLKRLGGEDRCRALPQIRVETLDDLAAVASACAVVVCGDTLVMHLAESLGVRTVVLFGPTCHAEITLKGRKVVSPYSCGPCYLRACDIRPSCMSVITPARVWRAVEDAL